MKISTRLPLVYSPLYRYTTSAGGHAAAAAARPKALRKEQWKKKHNPIHSLNKLKGADGVFFFYIYKSLCRFGRNSFGSINIIVFVILIYRYLSIMSKIYNIVIELNILKTTGIRYLYRTRIIHLYLYIIRFRWSEIFFF